MAPETAHNASCCCLHVKRIKTTVASSSCFRGRARNHWPRDREREALMALQEVCCRDRPQCVCTEEEDYCRARTGGTGLGPVKDAELEVNQQLSHNLA